MHPLGDALDVRERSGLAGVLAEHADFVGHLVDRQCQPRFQQIQRMADILAAGCEFANRPNLLPVMAKLGYLHDQSLPQRVGPFDVRPPVQVIADPTRHGDQAGSEFGPAVGIMACRHVMDDGVEAPQGCLNIADSDQRQVVFARQAQGPDRGGGPARPCDRPVRAALSPTVACRHPLVPTPAWSAVPSTRPTG